MDIDIDILKIHEDEKGIINELLTHKDVKRHKSLFGHLFFVTFNKNAIRGNHYHNKKHEYYVVVAGKLKVILQDIKSKKKKQITLSAKAKKITRLRIGPNIAHACFSLAPNTLMVGYYSQAYDGQRDTFEYVLIRKKK